MLLICLHACPLPHPPSCLSSPGVSQAINSHPVSSWAPAPISITSHCGRLQSISAQLLSPSNNMSVDVELFTSPVIRMAISIGFLWGQCSSLSQGILTTCTAHFQSFIKNSHQFSLITLSVSSGLPSPHRTGALPGSLCGLMEYKKGNQTDHW